MRSRMSHTITAGEVHGWAIGWLLQAKLLEDHGWLCTARVTWNVLLRAAARMISIYAACRDLANAPSDQAVFNALSDGLPKTLKSLERRLNEALSAPLPRRLLRHSWRVAIDWHLVPYYGEPDKSRNELYYGKPRQGTTKFHAYGTACIVQHGQRYTVALTWVRRHETLVVALRRLLAQIRKIGLKIKYVLLDRAVLQRAGDHLVAERKTAVLDARHVSRAPLQEAPRRHRPALDQASEGGLVSTHAEEQEATSDRLRMRHVSYASQSQRPQTCPTKAVVRCLACEGLSQRHSPAVSQAVRHRIELPSNASSAHPHLHAVPTSASGVCRRRPDPAKPLGLDSRHALGRRQRSHDDFATRTTPLQTNARLDRPNRRRLTT